MRAYRLEEPEQRIAPEELATHGVAETVQHDDLHLANVYERGGRFRLLDWGDTSIAHPFASLVVPFRFLARPEATELSLESE